MAQIMMTMTMLMATVTPAMAMSAKAIVVDTRMAVVWVATLWIIHVECINVVSDNAIIIINYCSNSNCITMRKTIITCIVNKSITIESTITANSINNGIVIVCRPSITITSDWKFLIANIITSIVQRRQCQHQITDDYRITLNTLCRNTVRVRQHRCHRRHWPHQCCPSTTNDSRFHCKYRRRRRHHHHQHHHFVTSKPNARKWKTVPDQSKTYKSWAGYVIIILRSFDCKCLHPSMWNFYLNSLFSLLFKFLCCPPLHLRRRRRRRPNIPDNFHGECDTRDKQTSSKQEISANEMFLFEAVVGAFAAIVNGYVRNNFMIKCLTSG